MADDAPPPTPAGLIRQVLPVRSPTRELRNKGYLAQDAYAVPEPMEARGKQARFEVKEIWEDFSQQYWNERGTGYDYENLADDPQPVISSTVDTSPAPLSLIPTSSMFPRRPRTTAAGYDAERMVATVMFRDGTLYNYYVVYPFDWRTFVNRHSKGQYIKEYWDGHRRGPAAVEFGDDARHLQAIAMASRTAQIRAQGLQKEHGTSRRSIGRRRAAWEQSSYAGKYARPY